MLPTVVGEAKSTEDTEELYALVWSWGMEEEDYIKLSEWKGIGN